MDRSYDNKGDMSMNSQQNPGTPPSSEQLSDFMVSLAALADDVRETDIIVGEVRELVDTLPGQVAQLSTAQATEAPAAPLEVARAKTKSLVARASAIAATLAIGTGGLGVAGALPAPMQHAFNQAVESIGQVGDIKPVGAVELYESTSDPINSPGVSVADASAPPVATPAGSDGSAAQQQVAAEGVAYDVGEASATFAERRSGTAAAVSSALKAYDRNEAVESLGHYVSAVASEGKAGGAAALLNDEHPRPKVKQEDAPGKQPRNESSVDADVQVVSD